MSHHRPISERLRRMVMDGLDITTLESEDIRAPGLHEYLLTRRFYAKVILAIVIFICLSITVYSIIYANKIDQEVISECSAACASANSSVIKVTAFSCVCDVSEGSL